MKSQEKLKEALYFYNPWWRTKQVPRELKLNFKRPVHKTLLSYLDLDRIVIIKGPRRTGKTTIQYQLIDDLLGKRIDPNNILYLSFDDIDVRFKLSEVIKIYEQIRGSSIKAGDEIYFFLDEIHFLTDWSFQVKKYFDRKFPIKFVISGSSASLIKKGAESLAGRTIEEIILPFNFKEYLAYKIKDVKLFELLDILKFDFSRPALPNIDPIIPYKQDILLIFQEYLKKGGIPSILEIKEDLIWQKILKEDVVQKVIYRDLVEYFGIKKPIILEKLFIYLAEHSSEILNTTSISNSLDLSRPYVEKYLDYLKQAFLIFSIPKYSRSIEKRLRANEKAHLIDNGFITTLGRDNQDKILETVIGRHMFNLPILYFRNHFEVDFVIDNKSPLPIEVKNKSSLDSSDFKGLRSFAIKFNVNTGILISQETLKVERFENISIYCLPAWLFCLLV